MGKILGIALIAVALFVVFTKADEDQKEMSIDDVKTKVLKHLELEKDASGKDICDAYAKMKDKKGKKERKKRESDDEGKGDKDKKKGKFGETFKELLAAVTKACKDDDVKPETLFKIIQPYMAKIAKAWKGKEGKGKKDKKAKEEE